MKSKAVQAAETIRDQIGMKALVMIGAGNFSAGETKEGEPYLMFKVQAGGSNRYMQITLRPNDLYHVEYFRLHGTFAERRFIDQTVGVFAENLATTIGNLTGLAVSL